jgi:hypothetical protein
MSSSQQAIKKQIPWRGMTYMARDKEGILAVKKEFSLNSSGGYL